MKNKILERLKYAICGVYMMNNHDAGQIAKNTLKVLRDELLRKHADINDSDYYSTIEFLNEILKDDAV